MNNENNEMERRELDDMQGAELGMEQLEAVTGGQYDPADLEVRYCNHGCYLYKRPFDRDNLEMTAQEYNSIEKICMIFPGTEVRMLLISNDIMYGMAWTITPDGQRGWAFIDHFG